MVEQELLEIVQVGHHDFQEKVILAHHHVALLPRGIAHLLFKALHIDPALVVEPDPHKHAQAAANLVLVQEGHIAANYPQLLQPPDPAQASRRRG